MPQTRRNWERLCQAAAYERDPDRLLDFVVELSTRVEYRLEELRERIRNCEVCEPGDSRDHLSWIQ